MAYSKFTSLTKFCKQYHLQRNTTSNLFEGMAFADFSISEYLLHDLQEAELFPLSTEKAKSEDR
ncbi:MAG: hypothetical protein ACKVTZ_06080, partial [Bacteroidia bacterium]